MNVAELMLQLSKLPPDMPVVIAQDSDLVGDCYGASAVELQRMRRDTFWGDPEVWDLPHGRPDDRDVEVCLIDFREPVRPIVEGDVEQPSAAVTRPAVEAPAAILAAHAHAIERYDRDTRTLQCADTARAELSRGPINPLGIGRQCIACNQPHGGDLAFCDQCWAVIQGRPR